MTTLREMLPDECDVPEIHLSADVLLERKGDWPGKHKFVWSWYVLNNGHAVGWNENPSRGWTFPVIKYSEAAE